MVKPVAVHAHVTSVGKHPVVESPQFEKHSEAATVKNDAKSFISLF